MDITFDIPSRPTVMLLEGSLEHKGEKYTFWYEYDARDGARNYEFTRGGHYADSELEDNGFDYNEFERLCQTKVEEAL